MGIKRYIANKDTTITNAYKAGLSKRGSDSNMGASDILEVFSIYAQASKTSSEISRALLEFPIGSINTDRTNGKIPASGSVNWVLRTFNAEHSETLPRGYTMVAAAVSQSWDEGFGLDMNGYTDPGLGNSGYGATWNARTTGSVSQGSLNLVSSDPDFVTVAVHDDFTFSDATTATNGDEDSAFSISAWIKADNLTNGSPILSKYDQGSTLREWAFVVQADGHLHFETYDEDEDKSNSATTAAGTVTTATWYHLVVTYDGTDSSAGVKFYKDGESVTVSSTSDAAGYTAMQNTAQPVWIGKWNNGSNNYHDGLLDEISVWKKELTQAEVTELYNSGCPEDLRFHTVYKSTATDLVAWWRFETSGVDINMIDTTTTIQDHGGSTAKHPGTGTSLAAGSFSTDTPGTCTTTDLYWADAGGTYQTSSFMNYTQYFSEGTEDLEVDITYLVEEWIKNYNNTSTGRANYGVGLYLTGSHETATRSYYTKKFFGRGSEFFFKRPILEARWDSALKDDSANFYASSSLAPDEGNINTFYLYNYYKGKLTNISSLSGSTILLGIHTSSLGYGAAPLPASSLSGSVVTATGDTAITGGLHSTGIYTASFVYTASATTIYPVWHTQSSGTGGGSYSFATVNYHTGSAVTVKTHSASNYNPRPLYVTKITNLKSAYSTNEEARFRLYVRDKDWNPTIYTKASTTANNTVIEDAYYKITRVADDYEVIGFGTGSTSETLLSYDSQGNYFDLDMSMLQKDYMYGIKFIYKTNNEYVEQKELFKFRVE